MGRIFRNSVEDTRNKLMNKLIALNVYKNEEQLSNLSLSELENEYKKIQLDSHPHNDTGSIHWINTK